MIAKSSIKTLILIALLTVVFTLPAIVEWALEQWRIIQKGQRAIIALEALLNESNKTEPRYD